MKILIRPRLEVVDLFSRENFKRNIRQSFGSDSEVFFYNDLEEDEKVRVMEQAEILIGPKIDDKELDLYKNLKMHQTFATGLEDYNFKFYKKNNILLCNTHTHSKIIAEYGFALLLSIAKEIKANDQLLRNGDWNYTLYPSITLFGKSILFLGYGNIAKMLKKLCEPFKMNYIAVKRTKECEDPELKIFTHEEKLLAIKYADIIINTLPLTKKTINFLDANEFSAMKPSVIIVNVGRGNTINEKELYTALKNKRVKAAALDVWYNYPKVRGVEKQDPMPCQPSKFPFNKLENVIMTAHRAWQSDALMADIKPFLYNVNRFIKGEKPLNIVNLDEEY